MQMTIAKAICFSFTQDDRVTSGHSLAWPDSVDLHTGGPSVSAGGVDSR